MIEDRKANSCVLKALLLSLPPGYSMWKTLDFFWPALWYHAFPDFLHTSVKHAACLPCFPIHQPWSIWEDNCKLLDSCGTLSWWHNSAFLRISTEVKPNSTYSTESPWPTRLMPVPPAALGVFLHLVIKLTGPRALMMSHFPLRHCTFQNILPWVFDSLLKDTTDFRLKKKKVYPHDSLTCYPICLLSPATQRGRILPVIWSADFWHASFCPFPLTREGKLWIPGYIGQVHHLTIILLNKFFQCVEEIILTNWNRSTELSLSLPLILIRQFSWRRNPVGNAVTFPMWKKTKKPKPTLKIWM